jgi:predicted HicB family RNase H-like nuclease
MEKKILLSMPEELHKKLKKMADIEKRNLSNYIRYVLVKELTKKTVNNK